MSARSLSAEMRVAWQSLSGAQRQALISYGIDPTDIPLGMIGAASIRIEGALYVPDPDGKVAFLTPCRVDSPLSPESSAPDSAVRAGDLVDIIAWHPLRPERWALRLGAADWLGAIEPQYLQPEPVSVRRSVLSWFQNGCTGIMPLSRDPPDLYRLLSVICTLQAEDDAHRAELLAALTRPWAAPPITLARRNRDVAA